MIAGENIPSVVFRVIFLVVIFFKTGRSQSYQWYHRDGLTDSVFGIGTYKAHEFLKSKKAKTLTVAVIDGGIDTTHPDLRNVLWINPKEKLNGKDDDQNGQIDDRYGWSYRQDSDNDNLELVRILKQYVNNGDTLNADAEKLRRLYLSKYRNAKGAFDDLVWLSASIKAVNDSVGSPDPSVEDISRKVFNNIEVNRALVLFILPQLKGGIPLRKLHEETADKLHHVSDIIQYHLNMQFNAPEPKESNDVQGPDALHGTHVAGIIAAQRNNGTGIDGIASNVKIMSLRVVPNGDERDEHVAKAIRYAVDNGASIINMSFGKGYSPHKELVDAAVLYAQSKDVLIIHSAGNDGVRTDSIHSYPNKYLQNGDTARAWIEVGASSDRNNANLAARFSNYGTKSVDIFAPGVRIYSTVPFNSYAFEQGTSMAAPVVTGVAALIRSYYPGFTAAEVKKIILDAAMVTPFLKDKCASSGVVNAFQAVKMADAISKGRNKQRLNLK